MYLLAVHTGTGTYERRGLPVDTALCLHSAGKYSNTPIAYIQVPRVFQ